MKYLQSGESNCVLRFVCIRVSSWTKPQVRARGHPNVLSASAWLNNFYRVKSKPEGGNGVTPADVDLSTPLSYADRFRMRHPGNVWDRHPPHIDGNALNVSFELGVVVY